MKTGISRWGAPKQLVCSLATSGTLPSHTPGQAYTGSFGVTGANGNITAELVSATPPLPAGWSLSVNQTTDQVTLSWPGTAPPGAAPLGNLGFESGDIQWLKGSRWVIDTTGLKDGGTWSAKYDGPGQSTLQHVQAVPVTPGTSITASCRISKGNNREDFAGGAVVLQWLDNTYTPISFNVGNVVNTGSSAFQTSTVTATAPPGSAFVRLAASGSRDTRGRARDKVYADNFTWNHSYAIPSPPGVDYNVVIRVRDGRGCQATLSQTIEQGVALNVISLLNLNGTNGSTTFTDQVAGRTWLRTGTAVISTAQSRYGGASLSIPNGSAGISTTGGFSNIAAGTDYCIEFWIRNGGVVGDNIWIARFGSQSGGSNYARIYLAQGLNLVRYEHFDGSSATTFGGPTAITNTAFSHVAIAVQNSGGNHFVRVFINGVLDSGASASTGPSKAVNLSAGGIYLAGSFFLGSMNGGFIDDFRMVVGSPVYTANFTPPGQHTL